MKILKREEFKDFLLNIHSGDNKLTNLINNNFLAVELAYYSYLYGNNKAMEEHIKTLNKAVDRLNYEKDKLN